MPVISVLIIDYHRLMREGLKALLGGEPDMRIAGEATNAQDGVALARQLQPDVVVMEIRLPNVDGIDAARQIRQWCPRTAILMLTMHDREEYLYAALRAGAVGYLLKDTPGLEVPRAIRIVAKGGSVLHPVMARKLVESLSHGPIPAADAPRPLLTERELQVLSLMARGASNREIAQDLYLAEKTIKQHASRIFRKLNVKSRSQAVIYAVQNGLAG